MEFARKTEYNKTCGSLVRGMAVGGCSAGIRDVVLKDHVAQHLVSR